MPANCWASIGRERMPDGVWHVDLVGVASEDRVAGAVGAVLGAREESGRPMLEVIVDRIAAGRMLLIVDNCEHLLGAVAALVSRLMERCAQIRVLATSREWLGVPGEQIHAVASLALPVEEHARPEIVARSEAVELFMDRARSQRPGHFVAAIGKQNVHFHSAQCRFARLVRPSDTSHPLTGNGRKKYTGGSLAALYRSASRSVSSA